MKLSGVKTIFAAVCLLIFGNSSIGQSYHGHQVWRIVPPSEYILNIVKELGEDFKLDFWKDPTAIGRPIDFRVPAYQINDLKTKLEELGILDYTIYISDVQALIENQKIPTSNTRNKGKSVTRTVENFDYSVYHMPDEVYEWMDMVVSENPGFVTKRQYGISYEGRPLYVLEFKKNSSPGKKPIIFVDALIHCREWITTASLLFIFKEMLQNPEYAHMLEDADWYFVPMINVDGYTETWMGDRLWRKTRSTGPSSICLGTDGNRNWNAFWSMDGASPSSCSLTYYGPTPFSESEVRHLAEYVLSFGEGNIDAFISTHSYGQLILYPYHYTAAPSVDDVALNETGKLMSDAIFEVHGKRYVYGPGSTTIYVSSGTTTDWTYEVAKVIQSHTFELRDTGSYGFLLPPDQIIPNGEEYLAGLVAMKGYIMDQFVPGSGFGP